ncbi:MAG TPA: HAD-IA family hydrolase [Chthoniobacteraceae bacterium]|nr:HAD-IA family hydrolase [Chthoniobacteraceae bacterium]
MVKIQAVTFDVGGTLIQPWPSVGHVYAEVAGRHGLKNLSPEQLNARFKNAWRARPGFAHSRNAWEELVKEVFGASTPPGFFSELYERFAEPDAWHIFDDVIPALDALASREIKLAVISNWDERLRPLLRALRLDRYFEAFAISIEVGFPKPSPVIFEHAATKLGLPPASILHVGDSLEMDVEGAKAAGFQALQIHRHAKVSGHGMDSLGQLVPIIGKPH